MITRTSPRAYVCFRCQLRLRPYTRIPQNELENRSRHGRGIRCQSTVAEEAEDKRPKEEFIRYEAERVTDGKITAKKHRAGKISQLSEHPLGRLHGYLGQAQREKIEELDTNSLGRPAEVIVLKDAGISFHRRPLKTEEEEERAAEGESVDILARLDSERGLVGLEEVNRNIDEQKPQDIGAPLNWATFSQLEKRLSEGFTSLQLARYIATYEAKQTLEAAKKSEGQEVVEESNEPEARISKIQVSRWMPGTSEGGAYFEEHTLRGYVSDEAFTSKQRLVVQLMRQCWQIEVLELTNALGEIEITVPNDELELMIKGNKSALRDISERYIVNDDERVEVFRPRHSIRVTAPKDKALEIVEAIKNTLHRVRYLEVDLNVLSRNPRSTSSGKKNATKSLLKRSHSDSDLDALALLTVADVQRLPQNKVALSCIARQEKTRLSSAVDIARRLLLTSSDSADRTIRQQSYYTESDTPMAPVRYTGTSELSWYDRQREWIRWTCGVSKPQVDEEPHHSERKKKHHRILDDSSMASATKLLAEKKPDRSLQKKPAGDVYWEQTHYTTSSVVVGHVLHELAPGHGSLAVVGKQPKDPRTIFHPTSENLSQVLGLKLKSPVSEPQASLRMEFIPSPWTSVGADATQKFPRVEMRFTIDYETKELRLKKIMAVVSSSATDVMLPERAVDLSFRQRTTSIMKIQQDKQLPAITEFLKFSQLNLKKASLSTPPGLILPIANHLFDPNAESAHDSTDVEYLFAGLEYRNAFATNFAGWRLLYTTVEGGKADGRRGELTHRPRYNPASTKPETRPTAFVNAAYKLVDALENSNPGHPVLSRDMRGLVRRTKNWRNANGKLSYFKERIDFRLEDWLPEWTEEEPQVDGKV